MHDGLLLLNLPTMSVSTNPARSSSLSRRIAKLSRTRFWLSKWLVAAIALATIVLGSSIFLLTSYVDFDTFLNYFALALLFFVFVTLFYGIIAIHDVPYELAKHRNHPHQDAIHAAGWVSLFTLHAIWPFLWIWAMIYRPDRGWGLEGSPTDGASAHYNGVERLERRLDALERRVETRAN
jgi:hypothetical protein